MGPGGARPLWWKVGEPLRVDPNDKMSRESYRGPKYTWFPVSLKVRVRPTGPSL